MVGLYVTVIGGVVLMALMLIGLWLTWISLRQETHTPKALRADEPSEPDRAIE